MKLTEKEKQKLAAIVIFKCIERELDTLRQKGNVTCPESDFEIIDAISGNINARRGQWRKTRPEGVASSCLYDALQNGAHRHNRRINAQFDSPRYRRSGRF